MKRWIIVIVLAGLTGILMLGFLSGLSNRVEVVVATHALAVGQTITEADIELRPIHASAVHDDAITALEDVIGKRLGQARLGGDQITQAALVGADNPLVPALEAGHRAIAVKVTDNQGLLGTLRPGDTVSVIGVNNQGGSGSEARLVLSGLKVLLVSYDFRYSEPAEPAPSGDSGNLTSLSSSRQRVREGVVVLDVPVVPISITVGISTATSLAGVISSAPVQVSASPVEVLALLNNDQNTKIHLALEPVGALSVDTPGMSLSDLFPGKEQPFDTVSAPLYVPIPDTSTPASGGRP